MRIESLTPSERAWLARYRAICLAMPDAVEAIKWGHPNFVVGGKIFASFGKEAGRMSVGFKCAPLEQAELVASDRYFVAPYAGRFGWVCYELRGRIPWREIAERVARSYQLVAAGSRKKHPAGRKFGAAPGRDTR